MIWREGCGERLEAWEGGYVCIIIADLNYCMAETNRILYKFKKQANNQNLKKLYNVSFKYYIVQFSSVQSLSRVWLFANPWTAACQASLSITNSQSPPTPKSIELVMPSNHLILCCPFLLLSSIFPSIGVFSNESALHIRWSKHWSFSFIISLSNEYSRLISFAVQGTLESLLQHHSSKASILA